MTGPGNGKSVRPPQRMRLSLNELRQQIAEARETCLAETSHIPYVRSRGVFLCTADAHGQCAPNPEAECPPWRGTRHEIETLIDNVLLRYPAVLRIAVSGGYDGAESLRNYVDGYYAPWVARWSVPVWERHVEGS